MKTKGKAWKLKNKGFTLIEMIVTVAIIAIFSGVVVTFIGTGSGVYRNTSSNSKVQMETQETFDKIEDLIIDANRSLYYANGSGSNIGAEIKNDIKEKGGTNSTGNKTFISCNEYENSDGTSQYIYDVLDWQSSDGKIYYSRSEYTAQSSNDNSENEDQDDTDVQSFSDESGENAVSDGGDAPVKVKNKKPLIKRSVLASGILDFRADVSKVESDKIVRFQLTTESGNKQIQTLHSVSLRNNVDLKKPADAFNNAEATDVGIKIINAPESMDPGESFMLAYGLTGNGTIDPTTVTWTVVENPDNGSFPTQDHTNGRLTISDSASGYITVQVSAVSTTGQLVKSQIVTIKINTKATPSPTPTPMPKQLVLKQKQSLLGAGQSYELKAIVESEMLYDDNSVKTDGYTLTWTSTPGLITVDGETLTIDSNAGKDTATGKVTLTATDSVTGLSASIEITIARIDIEKPFGEYKVGQNKEWKCTYKEGGVETETTRTINVTTKPTNAADYFVQGEQVQGTFAKTDVGSWEITAVVNLTIRNGIGQVQDVTTFSVDESEGGGEIHTPQSSGGDLAYVVAPGLKYKYQCGVDEWQDFQFKIKGVNFYDSYETIEWGIKGDDSIKLEPNGPIGAMSTKYTFTVGENSEGFVIWAKYTKHTEWKETSPIELEAYAEKTVSVITGISISTIPSTLKVGERYTPAINVNIKSPRKNSDGTYTSRAEVIPNIMNGDDNTWIYWKDIFDDYTRYLEKEMYNDKFLTAFTLKSLLPDKDNLIIVAELKQMPFLVKMLDPNYVDSMEVSSEN